MGSSNFGSVSDVIAAQGFPRRRARGARAVTAVVRACVSVSAREISADWVSVRAGKSSFGGSIDWSVAQPASSIATATASGNVIGVD